ncbi:MAG: energy-coupling factor transporter transmembrane protein EcfT [Anaerolineae bacterium]|nr:energy-coupling factor transporter transmembrane protein EcfT [Anaerolineae bacterium]
MSQFELLRNITIGQYIPTNSVVHRLDPRTKLLAALSLILAVSFSRAIIPLVIVLIGTLLLAKMARIPINYLGRGIALGLPVLALIFFFQLLFQGWAEPAGRVFFEWGWLRITRFSLHLIAIGLLRITCFIFLTSLFTMTTTTTEITHGVEKLLNPFRRFGVPSHELALINMIALRFVPTFAEEMEQVMKAQASRCADIDGGRKFWRPDRAARTYLPLIVPLFISAFRRAEELIWAMEARGYLGGNGRTKFVVLKSDTRDYLVGVTVFVVSLLIVLLPWPSIRDLLDLLGFANGL